MITMFIHHMVMQAALLTYGKVTLSTLKFSDYLNVFFMVIFYRLPK